MCMPTKRKLLYINSCLPKADRILSLFLVLYLCISELVVKNVFYGFGNITQVFYVYITFDYNHCMCSNYLLCTDFYCAQ